MIEEKRYPMGKTINCHHGLFELPSEIYEIRIDEDDISFFCEDGDYQATRSGEWKINKVKIND